MVRKIALVLLVLVIVLICTSVTIAADKEAPKYEVRVEIKYNAVTDKEAENILKWVLKGTKGACKVLVNVQGAEGWIDDGDSSYIVDLSDLTPDSESGINMGE